MCEYCEGQKKFCADGKGDGIMTMANMLDCLFGRSDVGEVARIECGRMWVDNSSGEYAELGFKINFCPNCGARMEGGDAT